MSPQKFGGRGSRRGEKQYVVKGALGGGIERLWGWQGWMAGMGRWLGAVQEGRVEGREVEGGEKCELKG